jgi:hypothetical protein
MFDAVFVPSPIIMLFFLRNLLSSFLPPQTAFNFSYEPTYFHITDELIVNIFSPFEAVNNIFICLKVQTNLPDILKEYAILLFL